MRHQRTVSTGHPARRNRQGCQGEGAVPGHDEDGRVGLDQGGQRRPLPQMARQKLLGLGQAAGSDGRRLWRQPACERMHSLAAFRHPRNPLPNGRTSQCQAVYRPRSRGQYVGRMELLVRQGTRRLLRATEVLDHGRCPQAQPGVLSRAAPRMQRAECALLLSHSDTRADGELLLGRVRCRQSPRKQQRDRACERAVDEGSCCGMAAHRQLRLRDPRQKSSAAQGPAAFCEGLDQHE
mmetsp:Transcript_1074/g.4557  ORF Transcript_1074/g.4557 Transcript_1074/m.4557 type:complete len:237 (+) Transcript_1074:473-1183(+)